VWVAEPALVGAAVVVLAGAARDVGVVTGSGELEVLQVVSVVGAAPGDATTVRVVTETVSPGDGWVTWVTLVVWAGVAVVERVGVALAVLVATAVAVGVAAVAVVAEVVDSGVVVAAWRWCAAWRRRAARRRSARRRSARRRAAAARCSAAYAGATASRWPRARASSAAEGPEEVAVASTSWVLTVERVVAAGVVEVEEPHAATSSAVPIPPATATRPARRIAQVPCPARRARSPCARVTAVSDSGGGSSSMISRLLTIIRRC
jgi:hypothetical protein